MRHTGIGLIAVAVVTLALMGCGRESADWKSATSADTAEAYQQFLQQHPKSANAAQAQARIQQIAADRDWQTAAAADSREAYEQFLAQHGDSKWAQEARIRIENFAQSGATPAAQTPAAPAVAGAPPPSAPMAAAPLPPAPTPKAHEHGHGATQVASSSAHGHYAQLGAFHSKAQAESQWKLLSAKYATELKSLTPHYVAAKSKGATVYKLRVSVSSAAGAKDLCSALKKHSQSCVPVKS